MSNSFMSKKLRAQSSSNLPTSWCQQQSRLTIYIV